MLLEQLKGIVGAKGWSTNADELKVRSTEWRGVVQGSTPMLVSPASTKEVSLVVRACADAGVAVVPQGGNTSLCAGSGGFCSPAAIRSVWAAICSPNTWGETVLDAANQEKERGRISSGARGIHTVASRGRPSYRPRKWSGLSPRPCSARIVHRVPVPSTTFSYSSQIG